MQDDEFENQATTEYTVDADDKAPFPTLTAREREVALLYAAGRENRDIAEALGISSKTFDTHRGHILKKLGLRNRSELTMLAVRNGWVTL